MTRPRWILAAAVVGAVGLQVFQPDRPRTVLPGDGPMSDHVAVPAAVDDILRSACADCHSASTRWPWYSHVSPVSWLIHQDVQHGRSNLDFSSWSTDPEREPTPDQRLRWMCENVRDDSMPPILYRLVHPESRLSEAEKELLCSWTDEARRAL